MVFDTASTSHYHSHSLYTKEQDILDIQYNTQEDLQNRSFEVMLDFIFAY